MTVDLTNLRRWAVLDGQKKYRYILGRQVSEHDGVLLFILLNPSTADSVEDDATIRRCIRFTESWGFGTLEVVNLFALRATNPEKLKREGDPIGPEARPMHPTWARALRDQCVEAGAPFFFKQWGEWLPGGQARHISNDALSQLKARSIVQDGVGAFVFRVGKKKAGRLLDGCEWNEMPKSKNQIVSGKKKNHAR